MLQYAPDYVCLAINKHTPVAFSDLFFLLRHTCNPAQSCVYMGCGWGGGVKMLFSMQNVYWRFISVFVELFGFANVFFFKHFVVE